VLAGKAPTTSSSTGRAKVESVSGERRRRHRKLLEGVQLVVTGMRRGPRRRFVAPLRQLPYAQVRGCRTAAEAVRLDERIRETRPRSETRRGESEVVIRSEGENRPGAEARAYVEGSAAEQADNAVEA